jgi:hypothetical protein
MSAQAIIAGLDPAIHHASQDIFHEDGSPGLRLAEGGFGPAGGSSPVMTKLYVPNYRI